MKWQKATFKGKTVWVGVSEKGVLASDGGRVPMRYAAKAGSKVYQAGASNLKLDAGHTPVSLDAGVPADSSKAGPKSTRGSGFGKAGTRTAAQAAAARQDAKQKIASLSEQTAIAFTDGGCRGNPGPAGSGVRLELPDGRVAEVARSLGRGTNNIAELTAIEIALDLLDEAGFPSHEPVAVLSDSSYANGVLVKGWKAKKNIDLIASLKERIAERPNLEVVWVAGHAGVEGNERADALATLGVEGRSTQEWLNP